MSRPNVQFLPLVEEGADALKDIAAWLADAQGNLDPAKAVQLASMMHPNDATKAQAFGAKLANAWGQQRDLTQQVTVMVGV